MGEFLGAGNAPGRPEIEKDNAFGIIVAERLRMAGEVLQREINGLLGLCPGREKKAQPCEEPYAPSGAVCLGRGPLRWCRIAHVSPKAGFGYSENIFRDGTMSRWPGHPEAAKWSISENFTGDKKRERFFPNALILLRN